MASDTARLGKGGVQGVVRWLKHQPPKTKGILSAVAALLALLLLYLIVEDHDNLFILAETVHALGITVLLYKLIREKSCAGLSLRSQELTAIFLGVRLYCSFVMEYDIHTLLDLVTLAVTVWVIYMMRFKLQASYAADLDTLQLPYIVIPAAVMALVINPNTNHKYFYRVLWAFCVYVEAVSVLPQLHLMQNTKVVEPFTAHYVFSLGVARFLSCAHWVLQVIDGNSFLMSMLGSGLWPSVVLLSEVVQTFILADFCYYYIKSMMAGSSVVRLPAGVV
eukprot:jgi/Chlat1/1586/Chrsp123S01842